MIAPEELLAIKRRLMVAADAARQIATAGEQFVMYDQSAYEEVVSALVGMKADVVRVLAELDILRGMFSEKLAGFLLSHGGASNAGGDSADDVADVPVPADRGSGEEVRQDSAGSGGGVPAERAPRKRGRRPKPRPDQAALPADTGELG